MLLDADFVHHWSKRYANGEVSAQENRLLGTTHDAIAIRGYLTRGELTDIVGWKSRRTLGVMKRDPNIAAADDTIENVTRVALARESTPTAATLVNGTLMARQGFRA